MPLVKSSLADALTSVFRSKPSSSADAASQWADAYVAYAQPAMSTGGSAAVSAAAGRSTLVGAFTAGFNAQAPQATAAAIAAGVTAFWQSMVWAGAGVGVTTVPGNFALAAALAAVFSDTNAEEPAPRAGRIADAFDAGAKAVVVTDTIPAAPTPIVVVGPIQ